MHLDFENNVYMPIQKCVPFHLAPITRSSYISKPTEKHRIKKKRRRRKLDGQSSLHLYVKRILNGPLAAALHELEGAYLSTFQIFSTESESRKVHSNNAFVLMDICRQAGINIKGVTSECKIGGKYRAPLLEGDERDTAKIVYVGNYNYFTKHPESKWSIKPCDKVYEGYI
jgi:hypothetical protein